MADCPLKQLFCGGCSLCAFSCETKQQQNACKKIVCGTACVLEKAAEQDTTYTHTEMRQVLVMRCDALNI